MSAIELAEARDLGTLPATGILGQRLANQFRLRATLANRQLTERNREFRIQINSGFCHLPHMVPYMRFSAPRAHSLSDAGRIL